MSRERCYDYDHENGFPRVSGDEPRTPTEADQRMPFSPRERG